jgi:hypothetical protein
MSAIAKLAASDHDAGQALDRASFTIAIFPNLWWVIKVAAMNQQKHPIQAFVWFCICQMQRLIRIYE